MSTNKIFSSPGPPARRIISLRTLQGAWLGLDPTKTMTNNNTKSKAYFVLWGYLAAFPICWATQAIFWGISGSRGSLLAFVLFRCEEFIRMSAQRMVGGKVFSYPPSAYAISVVVAALVVAVPLTGIYWMARAENRPLRWLGYTALALLAFMTFYWPSIPRDLF
jgi:hypothetical protein